MTILENVHQIFSEVKEKQYSFSYAVNKKVSSLGLSETDLVIAKDTLKSVINRYYFLRSEITDLIDDIESKEADVLVLALAMARYARNVAVNDVINFLRLTKEGNNYSFDIDKIEAKFNEIAKNPTPIPEKYENNFVKKVSLLFSYPEWIVGMMKKHFGSKNTFKTISSSRKSSPINICINPMKAESLPETEFVKTDIASTSYEYIGKNVLVDNPLFKHKKIFVMDQMEQLLADVLEVNQGDDVLIAGGIHNHLANLLSLKVDNFVNIDYACPSETVYLACKKMSEQFDIRSVKAFESDMDLLKTFVEYGKYDKVLLTPLNSELGLIRQKPEILITFKQNELDGLILGQKNAIREASHFVKEGGTFIYSVPTLNNKESFNIVNEFIAEDDSFELLEEKLIFPYVHKTSGLYYAKMKKKITEE